MIGTSTTGLRHEQPVQKSTSPILSNEDQGQCEPNFKEYEPTFRMVEAQGAGAAPGSRPPNATDDFFRDTLEIKESPQKNHTLVPSIPKDLLDAVWANPNVTKEMPVAYRSASLLTAPYRVVCNRKEGNFWSSNNPLINVAYEIDNDVKYSQPAVFDIDKELLSTKAKMPAQVNKYQPFLFMYFYLLRYLFIYSSVTLFYSKNVFRCSKQSH